MNATELDRAVHGQLPVEAQKHVTSTAYASLPLCVVLASDQTGWFSNRFTELCSYRYHSPFTSRDVDVYDYTDAFAYERLLKAETVPMDLAVQPGALVSLITRNLSRGRYLVAMTDSRMLTGRGPQIREFLLYGVDRPARTVLAVGYRPDRTFGTLQFGFDEFTDSIESMITSVRHGDGDGDGDGEILRCTSVAQILSPPSSAEDFQPLRLLDALSRHRHSRAPAGFDVLHGWWWYDRSIDVTPQVTVRHGLDTYDDLQRHIIEAAEQAAGLNFSMIHLYAEHKRLMLDRIGRLVPLHGAFSSGLAQYRVIAENAERLRLMSFVLMERGGGAASWHALDSRLADLRRRETEALDDLLAVAAGIAEI